MLVQSYLFFDGLCEEALAFYKRALGAEVTALMRNRESPDPGMCVPGREDKIMHANFNIGETQLMASDGHCTGKPVFQGFSLCIEAKDVAEAERMFAALGEGGQVQMPMMETFFSPRFGMVADKFGVSWMVLVPQPAG
jgi:PhnB protein